MHIPHSFAAVVFGVSLAGATSIQPMPSLFLAGSGRTGAQSPATTAAISTPSFDAVIAEVEAAQVQLVNGRPGAFKALWSHRDDVTLVGGLGGAVAKGWTEVSERLDWVATQYVDGARTHQEVARYVGQDLAYVVLRETIRFKRPGDRKAMIQELRVTQIFRREGGRWCIVHRHADSQLSKTNNG
jgi:ketosteroid isomerase-like protein